MRLTQKQGLVTSSVTTSQYFFWNLLLFFCAIVKCISVLMFNCCLNHHYFGNNFSQLCCVYFSQNNEFCVCQIVFHTFIAYMMREGYRWPSGWHSTRLFTSSEWFQAGLLSWPGSSASAWCWRLILLYVNRVLILVSITSVKISTHVYTLMFVCVFLFRLANRPLIFL